MAEALERHKIKRSMHHEVISSFERMLDRLEREADGDPDNTDLRAEIATWCRQWNRMTGDNRQPAWQPVTASATTTSSYDCD